MSNTDTLPELDLFLESIKITRISEDRVYNTITVLESEEFRSFRIRGWYKHTSNVKKLLYAVKEVTPDRSSGETSPLDIDELHIEIQDLLDNY